MPGMKGKKTSTLHLGLLSIKWFRCKSILCTLCTLILPRNKNRQFRRPLTASFFNCYTFSRFKQQPAGDGPIIGMVEHACHYYILLYSLLILFFFAFIYINQPSWVCQISSPRVTDPSNIKLQNRGGILNRGIWSISRQVSREVGYLSTYPYRTKMMGDKC